MEYEEIELGEKEGSNPLERKGQSPELHFKCEVKMHSKLNMLISRGYSCFYRASLTWTSPVHVSQHEITGNQGTCSPERTEFVTQSTWMDHLNRYCKSPFSSVRLAWVVHRGIPYRGDTTCHALPGLLSSLASSPCASKIPSWRLQNDSPSPASWTL